ncbi:MAG: putative peptidoglycan lipid II flippase [Flavobacteriales bacterium]|jgi:putative peptidoglycan lipid II flippase
MRCDDLQCSTTDDLLRYFILTDVPPDDGVPKAEPKAVANTLAKTVAKTVPRPPGLLRSSALVSSMTMASRTLGLVRDILLARYIGAGGPADAFYVAFKIPNFLRRLFAEGAFAQAFVPVLSEYREKGNVEAVKHFIDRVAGCLGVSLLAIVAVVVVASPVVTAIFGSGFLFNGEYEKFWLTSDLLRITFPYLFLISMAGFSGAILNSYDRFAVPAFTPVFLNIALIVAAAGVSHRLDEPVYALAWAIFIAGVLQLSFQLPFLARIGLLPRPKVDWKDKAVRRVLTLMAPAIFGVSVSQINLTLDTVLAVFLRDGSITWLNFSDRLIELPLGVFGVGIATVVLPSLSRQYAVGSENFSATIDWALRLILLISVPSTVALFILSEPILITLFRYGEMLESDLQMSSLSMKAYAIGLSAFMLIKVLASAYFSRQDMKTPVRIGIIAMISNMVMNLIFVIPLAYYFGLGHVGLALATACSGCLNMGMLYRGLRRANVYHPRSGWWVYTLQLGLSSVVMLSVLLIVLAFLSPFNALSAWARILQLALLVTLGGLSYLLTLLVMGMRPRHLRFEA